MIPLDPGGFTWGNDADAEPPADPVAAARDRSRRLVAIMRALLILMIG